MSPLALAILNKLLQHHARVCVPLGITTPSAVTEAMIKQCTISYLTLCESVDAQEMTRFVGKRLAEVAEWCDARELPPISALAVNGQTGLPGGGIFSRPVSVTLWHEQARQCIAFREYPANARDR